MVQPSSESPGAIRTYGASVSGISKLPLRTVPSVLGPLGSFSMQPPARVNKLSKKIENDEPAAAVNPTLMSALLSCVQKGSKQDGRKLSWLFQVAHERK